MTQHTGKCHVPAERLREILDALGMAPTRDWDDVLNAARCLHKNASGDTGQAREPDGVSPSSGEPYGPGTVVDVIAEEINETVGMKVSWPRISGIAHRAAARLRREGHLAPTSPDTGQAREPDAHPVGGFTHDPGLVALVAGQIAETYSDDGYQIRPDPGDVIADVMETVRADIRDRAEDQARCGKTDECAAKALVLARLADWLEGWPSGGTVQVPTAEIAGWDGAA